MILIEMDDGNSIKSVVDGRTGKNVDYMVVYVEEEE